MEAEETDEALMLRYAHGDASAFDLLYARHRAPVFRYLLRQLGSQRTLAEELFQDIWMNIIGARGGYKIEARFTTWLYTIAHNRVVDHYRRRRPIEVVQSDADDEDDAVTQVPAPDTAQPERIAQAREQARRLLMLVEQLPVAQREAFLLHEEAGLSVDEIATVTGTDREAIKSRLRYALGKLRRGMGDLL
jgi:RNA polymerase sigma-70 factor, ECF subfamily